MQQPLQTGVLSAVKSCTNALSLFLLHDAENLRFARTDGRTNTAGSSSASAGSVPSTFVMARRHRGVAVAVIAKIGTYMIDGLSRVRSLIKFRQFHAMMQMWGICVMLGTLLARKGFRPSLIRK